MNSFRNWYTQWWPPAPKFTESDVPSQVGRIFMVTGANTGIGFELCKMLYTTGATVYLATQRKEFAEDTINKIISTSPKPKNPANLKPLEIDLSDFQSIKAAAAFFSDHEQYLDILWNNAGVGSLALPASYRTVQGLNGIIGINAVGPHLLTHLLLPKLQSAARMSADVFESNENTTNLAKRLNPGRVRVVWTSSNLVDLSGPKRGIDMKAVRDGGSGDPGTDYAISKCANWAFAVEMARRYGHGHDGIVAIAQNPGNLNTASFQGVSKPVMATLNLFKLLSDPKYGAYTELFAGLGPEVAAAGSGSYIIPWGRIMPEAQMTRQDIVKALKPVDEGGEGLASEFWGWCEDKWRGFEE
ncbi:short-chain dehydrogenase [Colletotrichum truncatum]|uniref:Short-chain dehydrogenase n=1 Tax=Colletotrichum truncatum TaxID=5467 RepID=A0ACC3YUH8_COLTU|nr:short-chain dehydrogenase [Colletotrichum truncatum]KAF6781088.1 short-chain dehydrogenase [Colletotrichum truncatum]